MRLSRKRIFHTSLSSALLCITLSAYCSADEGQLKLSTGVDYSSGDYGDSIDTDIIYVPFSASYKSGLWTGKITAAWLSIDGPGNVIGGGDGGIILPGNNNTVARTESGLGDVWTSLSYELQSFPIELGYLDITGKIKIPTADEKKGLGTGETDYTAQLDYAYSAGDYTPLVTIAYKIKGDPSGGDLDNVFYLSAGVDWRQSDTTHYGFSIDFQEASTNNVDDSLELFTYMNYKLSSLWSLTPYLYSGLSESSPDFGGGLQFTYKP